MQSTKTNAKIKSATKQIIAELAQKNDLDRRVKIARIQIRMQTKNMGYFKRNHTCDK